MAGNSKPRVIFTSRRPNIVVPILLSYGSLVMLLIIAYIMVSSGNMSIGTYLYGLVLFLFTLSISFLFYPIEYVELSTDFLRIIRIGYMNIKKIRENVPVEEIEELKAIKVTDTIIKSVVIIDKKGRNFELPSDYFKNRQIGMRNFAAYLRQLRPDIKTNGL